MPQMRALTVAGLLAATTALVGVTPASATITSLERRSGGFYEVSPTMMHAIDIIVAEKMKMTRHRR